MANTSAKVYIVGAGPGDPDLITVRGRACLEQADVVLYDSLVHPALLAYARCAEHIYAGKRAGQHSLPQEDINRILIEKARACACVVRLKGGDPCIFGRGGEEALALAAASIPFEIIPGVTAGSAVPAYAGIPVTHRGAASSVVFLSAHPAEDGESLSLDLQQLALQSTLVLYMGVTMLPRVSAELVRSGRSPQTPAAVIEWGTYARQRVITGTLENIAAKCARAGIAAPALVVVGEVVSLRETLAWFETRPLHGLRVLATHSMRGSDSLERRLREMGADVLTCPAFEIRETGGAGADPDPADFDWLLLTSTNAVTMLFGLLQRSGRDARALAGVRICAAAGGGVAEALRARSIEPDAMPRGFSAKAVADAIQETGARLAGTRLLLPRADIARSDLAEFLRGKGALVDELVGWSSRPPETPREFVDAVASFEPHLVVFTNSAAARHFAAAVGAELTALLKKQASFASIGPVTTHALREFGFPQPIEPEIADLANLIETICAWWSAHRPELDGCTPV